MLNSTWNNCKYSDPKPKYYNLYPCFTSLPTSTKILSKGDHVTCTRNLWTRPDLNPFQGLCGLIFHIHPSLLLFLHLEKLLSDLSLSYSIIISYNYGLSDCCCISAFLSIFDQSKTMICRPGVMKIPPVGHVIVIGP